MATNWAADNLHTIRTLMERAALYRRTLAPMMISTGAIGTLAAAAGYLLRIDSPRGIAGLWLVVSFLAFGCAFLLVRRQALRAGEPLWSPPARRVAQAMLPPLMAGLAAGLACVLVGAPADSEAWWLPLAWVILYGLAAHAAGFFMPRGVKLFGSGFVGAGSALVLARGCFPDVIPPFWAAHVVMGFFFGLLHLAYGLYLYFTEKDRDAA